jgi:hypothetical protein
MSDELESSGDHMHQVRSEMYELRDAIVMCEEHQAKGCARLITFLREQLLLHLLAISGHPPSQ